MCGVCMGVCGCVHGYAQVCGGGDGSVQMYVDTHEWAWVLVGGCGINFQNTLCTQGGRGSPKGKKVQQNLT